jgi:hypothetical protein
VTNRSLAQRSARDRRTDLFDVGNDSVRAGSDASMGVDAHLGITVQILTADRDSDHAIGELGAVLVDGRLQCRNLIVDDSLSSRSPESQKQGGIFGNCRGDSSGWVTGGTTLLRED